MPNESWAAGRGHPSTVKAVRCHLDNLTRVGESVVPRPLGFLSPEIVMLDVTESQPRADS